MRPVLLELEGFGAFRLPTAIDFEDTDFFALVGPTGAGKSTVIDAICFALYGSVPRYDDQRLVASALSVGHQEGRVRLTFDVGGKRYVAARVVRRQKDKVATREARLEAADGTVLAGRASEMGAAVEDLLGLPFEHFTRCVVLPQGEFAKFLHDKPAERQAVLVRLLGLEVYGRMASAARDRANGAEQRAVAAAARAGEAAWATPEHEAELAERVQALVVLAGALDEATGELEALSAGVDAAADEAARAEALAAAIEAVGVPARVAHAARQVHALVAAEAEAEAAVTVAAEAFAAASAARADGPDVVALRAAAQGWAELATARQRRQAAAKAVQKAKRTATQAAGAFGQRAVAAAAAEEELEAARMAAAAHRVREHLEPGQACPVCEQVVVTVPPAEVPPAWKAAQTALERARREAEAARHKADEAERALAAAEATSAAAAGRQDELEATLADAPPPDELEVLLAESEALVAAEDGARRSDRDARAAHAAARRAAADGRALLKEATATFHRQRDAVAPLGPPAPEGDVLADWAALVAWAEERRREVRAQVAAVQERAASRRAERDQRLGRLATQCVEAGVAVEGARALGDLAQRVVRAEERARAEVAEVVRARAEGARFLADAEGHRRDAAVAAELARLLAANSFQRWLVAEALHALVEGASATLEQLSGGQYSLGVAEGEFFVVDHVNGSEQRSVRTLSGGETFQASLALALALADHLGGLSATGSAGLDAIFLDEGFGTLDSEALDMVAATIEALGGTGRMIGVVTHVAALAERVPVRYVVRKGPDTATVQREVW